MARLAKEGVDYFPHSDTIYKKTIFLLKNEFGLEGYAFWWQLLEVLASEKGHYYDCSQFLDCKFLSATIGVSEERLNQLLQFCFDIKAIDSELWEKHQIIWCQVFVDTLYPIYQKRRRTLPQKPCFDEDPEDTEGIDEAGGSEVTDLSSGSADRQEQGPDGKLVARGGKEGRRDPGKNKRANSIITTYAESQSQFKETFERWLKYKADKGSRYLSSPTSGRVPTDGTIT